MITAHVALCFERGRWRARAPGIDLEHSDLRGLDALLRAAFAASAPTRVHVRFEADTLPVWTRQYQAHYFNYVLRVGTRR